MILLLHRQANERSGAFMDHSGHLRDMRTGSILSGDDDAEEEEEFEEESADVADASLGTVTSLLFSPHNRAHALLVFSFWVLFL